MHPNGPNLLRLPEKLYAFHWTNGCVLHLETICESVLFFEDQEKLQIMAVPVIAQISLY